MWMSGSRRTWRRSLSVKIKGNPCFAVSSSTDKFNGVTQATNISFFLPSLADSHSHLPSVLLSLSSLRYIHTRTLSFRTALPDTRNSQQRQLGNVGAAVLVDLCQHCFEAFFFFFGCAAPYSLITAFLKTLVARSLASFLSQKCEPTRTFEHLAQQPSAESGLVSRKSNIIKDQSHPG